MQNFMRLAAFSMACLLAAAPLAAENKLFIEPQNVGVGDTGAVVPILLDNDQDLYGFSLSLVADPGLLTLTGINLDGTDYTDADFADGLVLDDGARISWGLVLDTTDPFDPDKVIAPGAALHIANVTLDVAATEAGVASVRFQDVTPAGSAPAKNVLVGAQGTPLPFASQDGEVTITQETVTVFIRGDSNGDTKVDISDAVYHLNFLFLGGTEPPCEDASDMDDNGQLEITDAIFLLTALFQGGPNPPEPFPSPGTDPTEGDSLGCDVGMQAP